MYNFIHIQFHVIYIKSNIPAKNLKIVLGITEFQNENNAISVA